jgi:two-component system, response regulator PdtaR
MTERAASVDKHIVVVVEDETLIRLFVCEALTEAGFDVVEAQHADAAVAILRARAAEIHALFTDIHMPGSMNALALAHLSRRSWPRIALLIASGLAHPQPEEMPHGSRFLPKPYHPNHVVGHLREMLAA